MKIKKGQIIAFSEGEYSDYCVNALVVCIREFDLKENKAYWELKHTTIKDCRYRDRQIKRPDGIGFLPWLVSQGLVEDVDYIEIHTGDYFSCNIQIDEQN